MGLDGFPDGHERDREYIGDGQLRDQHLHADLHCRVQWDNQWTTPQTVNHGSNGTAVTAVPSTGYRFVNWSDSSTANPRTDLNVTGNISVTANFAINTYTLTYTAGSNGTISGTTPQTVNHGSNGTAVTAVPNTGYHFTQWSDGVLTASRDGHERDREYHRHS